MPNEILVMFAKLAWALPWVLLHDPRETARPGVGADSSVGVRKTILDRIVLFETGKWSQLLAAALPLI